MIVAIHQPNFLPWLGFFDKMLRGDLFVYLDAAQFSRSNYQNRTRIKTPRGAEWLTVPVRTRRRFGQPTPAVEIDTGFSLAEGHLGKLGQSYGRSPGWPVVVERIRSIYSRDWQLLVPLNLALLEMCREMLSISTPAVLASTLPVQGNSTELLVSICLSVRADVYLAGAGSRSYLDERLFEAAGIRVSYQDFEHPTYRQPHGSFVAGLSVIDLLCSEGDGARELLRSRAASA